MIANIVGGCGDTFTVWKFVMWWACRHMTANIAGGCGDTFTVWKFVVWCGIAC